MRCNIIFDAGQLLSCLARKDAVVSIYTPTSEPLIVTAPLLSSLLPELHMGFFRHACLVLGLRQICIQGRFDKQCVTELGGVISHRINMSIAYSQVHKALFLLLQASCLCLRSRPVGNLAKQATLSLLSLLRLCHCFSKFEEQINCMLANFRPQ